MVRKREKKLTWGLLSVACLKEEKTKSRKSLKPSSRKQVRVTAGRSTMRGGPHKERERCPRSRKNEKPGIIGRLERPPQRKKKTWKESDD